MSTHRAWPDVSRARRHLPRACLALVVAILGALAGAGGATAATVTEFSAGIAPLTFPEGITAGPDGNLWFTDLNSSRIGRITPAGVVTQFSAGITGGSARGIAPGPDGNLWFAEGLSDRIGRITTAGVATEFSAGITPGSNLYDIVAGPDGNLWFTEFSGGRVGRITPAGVVTEFSAGITPGSLPRDITAGPDGNLWFTESDGRIGRITPAGVVTEFSAGITPRSGLRGIAAGPDGNLWFTESAGRIGRITPAGVVTEFSAGITPVSLPYGIAAGPDGNLWFTESADRIGRITPAGVVTEFSAGITPGSEPRGIAAGPDGNLWFTESLRNGIGRITTDVGQTVLPPPTPPILTLPKPVLGRSVNAQVTRGQVFVSKPARRASASASVPGLKGRNFVPLRGAQQIPVGSLLDTRKGTVRLTSARNATGATQSAEFLTGVFEVLQSRKRSARGLTELRLKGSSFTRCRISRVRSRRGGRFRTRGRARTPTVRGGRAQAARRSKRVIRRLRGRGSGRFSTRGRYSSATVRGTDWTVTDRCDGTLTQVRRGRVAVRDLRRKKTVIVRAGKRYLARAPG